MIPKILHFIWVGDESKRPDKLINTWRTMHPNWDIKVWGNHDYNSIDWINKHFMKIYFEKYLCGVADLMRYEILYQYGGITVDADSICVDAIDDFMLNNQIFAAWESEVARPGLIWNGTIGCVKGNDFIYNVINEVDPNLVSTDIHPWISVGPLHLTNCFQRHAYTALEIYPSYYFTPEHHTGIKYNGHGKIYAHQFWGSTKQISQYLCDI